MKKLLLAAVSSFLIGCGSSVSKEDYDELQQENVALKAEIEELKNGPKRLLNDAKYAFSKSDFIRSKMSLEKIISQHSSSLEHNEAQELLNKVNQSITEKKELDEKEAAEKSRLNKERLANAVKKLRTSKDEVKDITWMYDKSSPKYNDINSFHVYMGQKGESKPWLRLRIQYKSDDWLFIEKYLIKTDKNSYTIDADREMERDNGYGGIWEWYDTEVTQDNYKIIKDIIDSKNVVLRSEGKQYYKDRKISAIERQGLKNILDAYEALGGNLNFN